MKKSGVLLIVICILLILYGCISQSGDNSGSGSVAGNNGSTVTSDGNSTPEDSTTDGSQLEGASGQDSSTRDSSAEGSGENTNEQTKEQDEGSDMDARVSETLGRMTIDEKIGQMFILGFDGTEPGPDITEMIKSRFIGGIILFKPNINDPVQLLTLNNSLKLLNSGNKAPLLISVDEEGGRVSRMPDQLKDMPSSLSIGKTGKRGYAYDAGAMLAEEIKAFGFNTDFAPVLDIWSNPENTVIGDRAYGKTPEAVSAMGISAMKGIGENGVIPVVKHFPGHGDTVVDSHIGLPVVTYDMNRLESFELVPFKAALENGADAVMVAHIVVNALDRKYPASISKAVITGLLRESMGFDGVVITDDMTMGAIVKNYNVGNAAVKSVLAGSDIVLVCHGTDNQRLAMDSVLAAVKDGTIPVSRIDESVKRILRLKYKYRLSDNTIKSVDIDGLNKKIDAVLAE